MIIRYSSVKKYLSQIFTYTLYINVVLIMSYYYLGNMHFDDKISSVLKSDKYLNNTDINHICRLTDCNKMYQGPENSIVYEINKDKELEYVMDTPYSVNDELIQIGQITVLKNFDLIYKIPDLELVIESVAGNSVMKIVINYIIVNVMFIILYTFLFVRQEYLERRRNLIFQMGTEGSLREQNMRILTENIHHELNTPVAIIRGNIEALQIKNKEKNRDLNGDIDFDQVMYSLDQIETVFQRMSNFKQIKYSNGNRNIEDIIKYSANSMNIYKRSNFMIYIDDDLRKYTLNGTLRNGDLMNVISNHLRNSLEANSSRIYVQCKYQPYKNSVDEGKLHIFIVDNGTGIRDKKTGLLLNKKQLSNIFKPYYSTKDDEGNHKVDLSNDIGFEKLLLILKSFLFNKEENIQEIRGVGLYLNKQLLIDNGGDIELKESTSQGVVFDITVDVKYSNKYIKQLEEFFI